MNIFETKLSAFIEHDNRKFRKFAQPTAEMVLNKCEATLKPEEIQGKTILDLGCCIGAMGAWALENGAAHYTGVEYQQEYVHTAISLFETRYDSSRYTFINDNIVDFLERNKTTYDIVLCIGVIYSMTDILTFIKNISNCCREYIIIDSMTPTFFYNYLNVIEISYDQKINVAPSSSVNDGRFASYEGVGLRPTIEAMKFLFECNGLSAERIFPSPLVNSQDVYNDVVAIESHKPITEQQNRFMLRCSPTTEIKKIPLLYDQVIEKSDKVKLWPKYDEQDDGVKFKWGQWKFDSAVASRFRQEALNNIPDYIKVINLSVDTLKNHFGQEEYKTKFVLDVGSAIGETVNRLIDSGFNNAYGVEKSRDMVMQSNHPERIILSDQIPIFGTTKWDGILINWTLHFIEKRFEFLETVFDQMTEGGIVIITDKMDSDDLTIQQYVDFKLERGMSINEIQTKAAALSGILTTKPLTWYLESLEKIGFKNIQVINTRLMFNTIVAFR